MTHAQLTALLPVILLAGTAVALLLVQAITRSHRVTAGVTLAGLAAALVAVTRALPQGATPVTALLTIDRFALLYTGLLALIGIGLTLLSFLYLAGRTRLTGAYYILFTLALAGGAVLASSAHFAAFFLGLEMISVSLFALAAYRRDDPAGIEAGMKYLVLAGVATAVLLFGAGLLYARYGTMAFAALGTAIAPGAGDPLTLAGIALVVAGIGFKLTLAPFHLWAPDVYEGAPAPVTGFIATISKAAVFALLLRLFTQVHLREHPALFAIFATLAIASIFAGNLLGLRQMNLKRVLAYSSVANMGYLLIAFLAGGPAGAIAATFYLTAYLPALLGIFTLLTALSGRERDADAIADYAGLAWRRPVLAAAFTVLLLSLAGIPLTGGFIGKFYVALTGVSAALAGSPAFWALVGALVVGSVIGLYYYLRIVLAFFQRTPAGEEPAAITRRVPDAAAIVLTLSTLAVLWLGVLPGNTLTLISLLVEEWFR